MTNHFHRRASFQLLILMLMLYAGACLMWLLQFPLKLELQGVGLVFHWIHFYLLWHYHIGLNSTQSISQFWHTPDKGWYLQDRASTQYPARLQLNSVCTRYYSILSFQLIPTGQTKTLVLVPDSLTPQENKQLRQLIWWGL